MTVVVVDPPLEERCCWYCEPGYAFGLLLFGNPACQQCLKDSGRFRWDTYANQWIESPAFNSDLACLEEIQDRKLSRLWGKGQGQRVVGAAKVGGVSWDPFQRVVDEDAAAYRYRLALGVTPVSGKGSRTVRVETILFGARIEDADGEPVFAAGSGGILTRRERLAKEQVS